MPFVSRDGAIMASISDHHIRLLLESFVSTFCEQELADPSGLREALICVLTVPTPIVDSILQAARELTVLRSGLSMRRIGGEIVQ